MSYARIARFYKLIVPVLECAAAPSAQWLLSDFQVPARGWRRLRAQCWLALLYRFFRVVAGIPARHLPPTERILGATSFKPVARKKLSAELLCSTLYQRGSPAEA
jgi:hypothetical protein